MAKCPFCPVKYPTSISHLQFGDVHWFIEHTSRDEIMHIQPMIHKKKIPVLIRVTVRVYFKNTTFVSKIQLLGLKNTVFELQRLAGLLQSKSKHIYCSIF